MPKALIPFGNQQESGWEELAGASPSAINVIVDGKGAVRRRPCIASIGAVSTTAVDSDPCIGIHTVASGDTYAVFSALPGPLGIYKVSTGGGTSLLGSTVYPGSYRPSFAETEGILAIANDVNPLKIAFDTGALSRLGGSPPRSTHVVAHGSRLLMNNLDETTQLHYSGLATGGSYLGHEQWADGAETYGLSGQIQADARPDDIVAVGTTTNEVFAFGATNVQVFSSDERFIYSPTATRDFGCSAPFSIISADNDFAWLDDRRRFVVSDGRSFTVISDPVKKTLDDMTTVSDCFGYRVLTGPAEILVWTFPSDGRTFAYQKGGGWAEWQGWSSSRNNWQQFRVTAHNRHPLTNVEWVGLSDGKLAKLSLDANDDLGDIAPAYMITGRQNHDTEARKHCAGVRLVIKRGSTTDTTAPMGSLSWKDDGGPWCQPIQVDFGASGDTYCVVQLRSLGVYRGRQWKFSFHGSGQFVLVSAEEEFTVLE